MRFDDYAFFSVRSWYDDQARAGPEPLAVGKEKCRNGSESAEKIVKPGTEQT
jgi:hypothetical protein